MPLEGEGKSTRNRAEGDAGNSAESAGKVGGVPAGLGFPAPISQQPGEKLQRKFDWKKEEQF